MNSTAKVQPPPQQASVRSITPCLTFKDQAEEAVNFYVSVFRDARIVSLVRSDRDGPVPKGKVLNVAFELGGQRYTAFDGGAHFQFTDGFSLMATCDTQEELDRVWHTLSSDGGREIECGWLKDRFGVSWQVVPASLMEMMAHPERGNVHKLLEAVWSMVKLDVKALETAYLQS